MTGHELTAYIIKAEGDHNQEASVTKLLGMLSRGEVKAADIQAHYKLQNAGNYRAMVQSFTRGELWRSQKQNFTNWLNGRDWKEDEAKAYDFKALAELSGINIRTDATFRMVWTFVMAMIINHPYQRKELSEFMGLEKMRDYWFKRCQKEGWTWMPQ
jgi:hypothetical protein